ncbi:MAG: hypothetical protein QOK14_128 [Frankiaceae bacterium]|nr:hypothetical protein [Frankiaceae bacterium]
MSVAPARIRRRTIRARALSVLSVAVVAAAPAIAFTPAGHAATCMGSGTDATIQAALSASGSQAILCPGAVFSLANTVHFTAPNQAILTEGLPTDNTRAILRIASSSLTGAIDGGGQSGVTVENIEVDGNIGTYGRLGGPALMEMGNQGSNQTIQNVFIHDTRSWSTIHVMEGSVTNDVPQCQNARVLNNLIMSAGTNVPSGSWADGISLACGTSLVQGNTVIDATDGSIVIFGAAGSTVQNNTIIAQSRVMLGGINLVDYNPVHGNYTGTKVLNNTIDARGALIKIGVASGPGTWFCEPDTTVNHGATIQGNTLQGAHMGYGFAVRGVSQWTITGNTDNSTHTGVAGSMCGGGTQNPQAPGRFQYYAPATSATLQPEFQAVTGNYWGLLNVSENVGASPLVYAQRSSLTYAPVAVGASATQTETITNTGPATATVTGVTATGDFTQSNNCSSLPTGSSCVVNVTFRPSATGTRTGTVTVNSNAGNGPATVSLTGTGGTGGTGSAATLTANPTSLTFPSTNVNSQGAAQNVTIANAGSAAASITGITVTGDYGQSSNCGATLAAGASCLVSVGFVPTATGQRNGTLTIASNASNPSLAVPLSGTGTTPGGTSTNVAAGRPATASSSVQTFVAANSTDADPSTYWESASNAFPQWLQVDLGSSQSLSRIVLRVPPATSWATRTQTLSVSGSNDGTTFSTLAGSAGYTFNPSTGNTSTINLPAGSTARYVRVTITANTGWPAGQVSQFEVWNASGSTPPTLVGAPASDTFPDQTVNTTSAARVLYISNTGGTAAAVSGITTTGDFILQSSACGASIAANSSCNVNVQFRPTATGSRSGSLVVSSNATNPTLTVGLSGTGTPTGSATLAASPTSVAFANQTVNTTSAARAVTITNSGTASATLSGTTISGDFQVASNSCATIAAGASCTVNVTFRPTTAAARTGTLTLTTNASTPTLTVALSGTGVSPTTNLAAGRPTSESGHSQTYVSGNATDGNQATYWESVNNSFPQWLQVDLGSAQTVGRVVLKLPASWGSRVETLSVSGSTDGTTFTSLKASTSYTFDPASGNTVTITFTAANVRYLRLTVTANTGWPAGQLSEVEAYTS